LPARLKVVATPQDILISCRPLRQSPETIVPVSVMCIALERGNPEAKSLPYAPLIACHRAALAKGFGEALLTDRNGCVTEGATSNLFWVKDAVLCTPGKNMLQGITR